MSVNDKDLPFKLFGKRLAWAQGYTPLLNVAIRSPIAINQIVTDADVLGWRFNPDGAVSCFLADCRDTSKEAMERVLWVRGLAEYFGANQVLLLKRRIPPNARWIASQLKVKFADGEEIARLTNELRLNILKGPYFDEAALEATTLPALFQKESDYRRISFFLTYRAWTLPPAECALSLMELFVTGEMYKTVRPDDTAHRTLVLTGALLFGIALGRIFSDINMLDMLDFRTALRHALYGGQDAFEQRERVAIKLLQYHGGKLDKDQSPLDLESFPLLAERGYRFIGRRYAYNDAIRFLDVARHYVALRKTVPELIAGVEVTMARKFGRDLLDLFIQSNKLDPGFSEIISVTSTESDSGGNPTEHDQGDTRAAPKPLQVGVAQPESPIAGSAEQKSLFPPEK